MQSQYLSFDSELIVLVQAPDQTHLSLVFAELSNHGSSSGVKAAEPRPRKGPHSPSIHSVFLLPNPWSRPLQPGCPVIIKTTSGKTRVVKWWQLCVFNATSHKRNSHSFYFISQRHGGLETLHFQPWMRHFQVSTAVPVAARGCFFSTFSRGLVPFWKLVLLFQANYPNHCQCATG